jgi:peroxiredoxin Q/BCP
MIEVGQPFPDFSLPDQNGKVHRLSDYQERYVVLYVYPKDDTPGCTKEACAFRDNQELRALGVQVLGVSPDDAASHQNFAAKFSLNFPLLADEGAGLIREIGAWGPKQMYGKQYEGVSRSTFLIGPSGTVLRVWPAVKVEGHSDDVLLAVKSLLQHA